MSALYGAFLHVRCGSIRGYVEHVWSRCGCEANLGRYQSCPCDPAGRWEGADVSELLQPCVVCVRAAAGGPSRWSWLACGLCRQEADRFEPDPAFGLLLPLGRHSVMNQRWVRARDDVQVAAGALMSSFVQQDALFAWRQREVARLAGTAELVPWGLWRERHPASAEASRDALRRLHAALAAA